MVLTSALLLSLSGLGMSMDDLIAGETGQLRSVLDGDTLYLMMG